MHPNSYSSLHLLRPHLNGRNLSLKIATQLERLLPSSSFCIVCILLFPPVHIVVFISLVLNCKEYILAPLVALYFTFFWLTGSTSRGETWATAPRIQLVPGAGPLSAFMFRKSPGCPLSSSPLILDVQQSVDLTWTQTSDSLRYCDSGRRVCVFRDSSNSVFSSCSHLCSRALSTSRGSKEEHESVHVCVCVTIKVTSHSRKSRCCATLSAWIIKS